MVLKELARLVVAGQHPPFRHERGSHLVAVSNRAVLAHEGIVLELVLEERRTVRVVVPSRFGRLFHFVDVGHDPSSNCPEYERGANSRWIGLA